MESLNGPSKILIVNNGKKENRAFLVSLFAKKVNRAGPPATAEIRREYFKGNYPAATGMIVNGLLRKGWLIEIEALAILD